MRFSKEVVLSLPGVTQLTFHDESLFRLIFSGNHTYYSSSWLYLLRASRLEGGALGYKFISEDLAAVIGYRNGFVYITPILDRTKGVRLQELCNTVDIATGRPIVLKKLLQENLTTEVIARLQTNTDAPLEDDSQPETVLRLDKLFMDKSGTLNPIASSVIRKARAYGTNTSKLTVIESTQDIPLQAVEHFLRQWPAKYTSYVSMIRYMCLQNARTRHYRFMIFMEQDLVKGVYLAEKLSFGHAGLYCGVTAKDKPGMTEWMDLHFFQALFREGINSVYLGGAERQGVTHFVNKLLPYKPDYETSAALWHTFTADAEATVHVRLATKDDVTALARLYRESYNSLDILGERWTSGSARKFISHLHNRQPDLFFVAEAEGKIVSAAVAAIQPWWDGNHLVEGEVFTDPHNTEKGIEKALLKTLLLAARSKYYVVAWDTILPNIADHPLGAFEAIGFKEVPHWRAVSGDLTTMLTQLGE